MAHRKLHKILRIPSLAESLAERSQFLIKERQQKQREWFWSKRQEQRIFDNPEEKGLEVKVKSNPRLEMLKKWKKEKIKRLEEEKKNKKPAFKVGIVQRKANGSPLLSHPNKFNKKSLEPKEQKGNCKNKCETSKGVVTRSMSKKREPVKEHLKANDSKRKKNQMKLINNLKKQQQSHVLRIPKCVANLPNPIKLTFPCSPQMTRRNAKSSSLQTNFKINSQNSRKDKNFLEILKLESITSGVVQEKESVKPIPCLMQGKYLETDKEEKKITRKSQTVHEEKEFNRKIYTFRSYIDAETKKLTEACNKWKCFQKEFCDISKDIEGEIDCLIGKTNLLTSDKLKQFSDLIDKCEKGDPLIKVDDLQGFQDWVSIEVNKLNDEFNKLERQKHNDWKAVPSEKKLEKCKKAQVNDKPVKRPQGKSNIRAHIMAARQLLKERKAFDFKTASPNSANKENVHTQNPAIKQTFSNFDSICTSPRVVFQSLNNMSPKVTRSKAKSILWKDSKLAIYSPGFSKNI